MQFYPGHGLRHRITWCDSSQANIICKHPNKKAINFVGDATRQGSNNAASVSDGLLSYIKS